MRALSLRLGLVPHKRACEEFFRLFCHVTTQREVCSPEEGLPAWVTTHVWTSEATELADTRKEKKKNILRK